MCRRGHQHARPRRVNVALIMVASITIAAFCLCVILYLQPAQAGQAAGAGGTRAARRAAGARAQAAEVANGRNRPSSPSMSHDIRLHSASAALSASTTIIEGRQPGQGARLRRQNHGLEAPICSTSSSDIAGHLEDRGGKASLILAEFDLGDSLAAAESSSRPWRDKGQTFCAENAPSAMSVIGDDASQPDSAEPAVERRKYTPEGGRIWLRFIGLPGAFNAGASAHRG